jgi:DNA-binding MarR family transcriptional regulator
MGEPRWLTADEQRSWRKLAGVLTLLPAALDAQLQRDAGLTHFAYWVLAMLSETPGRTLQMTELAAASRSSLSRLSHTVARLERGGWVRRERSPDDARATVAVLTDEGWAKVVETAPGHVEAVRMLVFDVLSPAQVGQLDDICTQLLSALGLDTSDSPPIPPGDFNDQKRAKTPSRAVWREFDH